MKNYKKIEALLETINISVDRELEGMLENGEVESFDDLRSYLEDNSLFDVEIIYYATAMDYLREHDNSLTESLVLAHEMGYTAENINSELLASLLASQNVREDFEELESEITELLN